MAFKIGFITLRCITFMHAFFHSEIMNGSHSTSGNNGLSDNRYCTTGCGLENPRLLSSRLSSSGENVEGEARR